MIALLQHCGPSEGLEAKSGRKSEGANGISQAYTVVTLSHRRLINPPKLLSSRSIILPMCTSAPLSSSGLHFTCCWLISGGGGHFGKKKWALISTPAVSVVEGKIYTFCCCKGRARTLWNRELKCKCQNDYCGAVRCEPWTVFFLVAGSARSQSQSVSAATEPYRTHCIDKFSAYVEVEFHRAS